jgi:hypothetical protein
MLAIVLTCDRYRALADHMLFKYAQLWPDHPFRFRLPYQDLAPTSADARVDYIKSPLPIKPTVLGLLRDLDDEELIYWSIDDKYPISLNLPRIRNIHRWLVTSGNAEVAGLLFCRSRRMWVEQCLTGQSIVDDVGNVYLERSSYAQIWIHQFLRVKVLRNLFESFPDVIPSPKAMDAYISQVPKPLSHRIFVSRENLAVFGESTSRGVLTLNCHRSLAENGLTPPLWATETTGRETIMGRLAPSPTAP